MNKHMRSLNRKMKKNGACMKAHGFGFAHNWLVSVTRKRLVAEGKGINERLRTEFYATEIMCGNCLKRRKVG